MDHLDKSLRKQYVSPLKATVFFGYPVKWEFLRKSKIQNVLLFSTVHILVISSQAVFIEDFSCENRICSFYPMFFKAKTSSDKTQNDQQ